jgi:hypothetical protein
MINTCLKLLLRTKTLYNAKADVHQILKKIKRIEKIKEELMPKEDGSIEFIQSSDLALDSYNILVELS